MKMKINLMIILQILVCHTYLILCGREGKKKSKYTPISTYPGDFFERNFVNNRPIIGVLTLGLDGKKNPLRQIWYAKDKAYVGSSYVKFIESAGARVVPIVEDIDDKELRKLLSQINGVLLPGNDIDSGDAGYFSKVKTILQYSKNQMKEGEKKFPVLGIGRGAQRIVMKVVYKDFLEPAYATNLTMPLNWNTKSVSKSKLFGKAPKGILENLGKKPLATFFDTFVMPEVIFANDTKLMKSFRVLSTNVDRNGTKFISTFESKKYPWYGLCWHPEKPQFEFNPVLSIDHSIYSIIASQYLANFFVSEARENDNTFASHGEEIQVLIAKDRPYFVGNITDSEYDQIYVYDMKQIYSDKEEPEDYK